MRTIATIRNPHPRGSERHEEFEAMWQDAMDDERAEERLRERE